MQPRLVAAGALLLFVSAAVLIGTRAVPPSAPLYGAAAASLALAAGSWAAGRPRRNEPL